MARGRARRAVPQSSTNQGTGRGRARRNGGVSKGSDIVKIKKSK